MKSLNIAMFFLAISGCGGGGNNNELDHKLFHVSLVEGTFIDDYNITNNTPHKLSNVDIKVTATGINGDKKTAKQFWAVWDPGEKKTIEGSFWSDTSVLHFPRKSLIKPPCSPAVRTASGDSPLSGQRGQRG